MQKVMFTCRNIFLLCLMMSCMMHAQNLNKAVEAYNAGNYETAASLLESTVNVNSPSLQEFQYLANSYIALKNNSKAISTLERAAKYFPDSKPILFSLGQLCAAEKRYSEASKYLKMIKGYNSDKQITELLALVYFNDGLENYQENKLDKAVSLFRNCIEADPRNKNAYSNLISILYQQKKLKETKAELDKAVKLFPGEINFRKSLASVLAENKEYKPAISLLKELSKEHPGDADILLQLAKVYSANYELGKADTAYSEALIRFPKSKQVYDEAINYWNIFNNQEKLRETYLLMRQNLPDEKNLELKIGKTYENENKPDEAKKYFSDLIKTDSLNIEIRYSLAALCRKTNDDSTAETELIKILTFSPEYYPAYKMLNAIRLDNKELSKAIALNTFAGEKYYAKYQLGLIYKELNQADSSEYFFEEAYRLKPSDPFVLKEKAKIEITNKQNSKAVQYARLALKNSIVMLDEEQSLFRKQIAEQTSRPYEVETEPGEHQKDINKIGDNIDEVLRILKNDMSDEEYSKLLDEYLEEYPRSTFLLLYKAEYYSSKYEYNKAEELYRKVLVINPAIKKAHIGMAFLYQNTGKTEQAMLSLRRAMKIDPEDDGVYKQLIKIAEEKNMLASLCDDWKTIYSGNPGNKILRERLIEILHKAERFDEAREIINLPAGMAGQK